MSRTNFTSETLRLEPNNSVCSSPKESDRTNNQHLQASVLSASQGFQKKKVSSFQITSIRPTSRSSNDGADDSENDTEDTSDMLDSSRVTIDQDQETPSFSEDCSKSEELLLGPAPVIPTSSQYGITALVQQTGAGGMMTARLPQGVTVNVTEGGLALAKADGEQDDLDNWQKRFKIVKIDSTEPFKRGRWICLDFMDSPALSSSENKSGEMANLVVSNVVLADGDSKDTQAHSFVQIPLSLSSTVQYSFAASQPVPNQFSGQVHNPVPAASTPQVPPGQVQGGGVHYTHSTGQPMQVIPGYSASSQASQGSVHPAPSGQASSQVSTSSSQSTMASSVHSKPEVQQQSSGVVNSSVISQGIQSGIPTHNSSHSQSTVPVTQQSEQSAKPQGLNISQQPLAGGIINQGLQPQVIGIPPNQTGIQQQQQQQQPPPTQQQPISQGISQPPSSTQQISQNLSPQQNSTTMHPTQIQPNTQQHIGLNQPISIGQQIPNSHSAGSNSQSTSGATQQIPSGTVSSVTSTIQAAASYTSLPGTGATPTPATTPAQPQISIGTGQSSIQADSLHQLQPSSATSIGSTSTQHHPSTLEGISMTSQAGDTNASSKTATTGINISEEAESASTASTVAIDNKIEQAMDLVKSHLMFAVREEVDVLKDKIVELMDRIKHLECENTILRQYASPEVLQQLQSQMTHQLQQTPHHSSTS